jgi:phosphonate transport system permease protein
MSVTPEALGRQAQPRLRVPMDSRRSWLLGLMVVSVIASIWSLRSVGFSISALIEGFRESGYLGRALPPSFEGWQESLKQLGRTFSMAVAGTALAGILAIPCGVLAARNTAPSGAVRTFFRAVIVATRAIPDLVFAIFFVVALSIGELPGVLALGIHSIGMLGKLLADFIEDSDEGPREAAFSAGASRLQAIATSIVPQITPQFLSALLYRLDINTRVSVVLGFVGAGGIGMELRSNLRNPLRYPVGIGQALMVLALILIVDRFSVVARRALDGMVVLREEREDSISISRPDRLSNPRLRPPMTLSRRLLLFLAGLAAVGTSFACLLVGLHPVSFASAVIRSMKAITMFFPPDFTTGRDQIISAFGETIAIGLAATAIGFTAAIPFAVLVAQNTSPNRFVCSLSRSFQVVLRGIPELVIVLLFISAVGLGPLPGAAALALGTFGFTSKLLADVIETLPDGPAEGSRATGATRSQELATAVGPQIVPGVVATGLYAFDVNIRSSAVLGMVGAGGIGRILDEANAMLMYETVAAIVITLFVIVFALEQLSSTIRKALG